MLKQSCLIAGLLLASHVQTQAANPTEKWPVAADYAKILQGGRQFHVDFDYGCPADDARKWTGNGNGVGDPMGSAVCGARYTFRYFAASGGTWVAHGHRESTGQVYVEERSAGQYDPSHNSIVLWGRVYKFDNAGYVYDVDYGLVGFIKVDPAGAHAAGGAKEGYVEAMDVGHKPNIVRTVAGQSIGPHFTPN